MARFVRILGLYALCVAFVPWPDTSAQIASSTVVVTSNASSMTLKPSYFLAPSITTAALSKKTSSITKPSNSSSIKPSNSSSIKPSNSSSIKPSNSSSIKPSNSSSIKPSNSSSIKPSKSSSIKPSNTSSIKPSNTSSIKPSNTSSIKPSNTSSIKPSNTSSIKPSNTSSTFTMTSIHNMTVTSHSTATPSHKTPSHSMTIKPSSAHSVMPTSSVSPSPPPRQGNFSVKQNGSVCLIADMEVVFTVSYMKNKGLEKVMVTLPLNANVGGLCQSNRSSIVLMWPPGKNLFQFTLNFSQSSGIDQAKSGAWAMDHLTLIIVTTNNTQFPGAKGPNITFTTSTSQLKGELGKAYRCIHGVLQYNLGSSKTQSAIIKIKNYEFQPFDVKNGTFSDNVQHCPEDSHPPSTPPPSSPTKKPPNTVAIAVGCSLAGLIIIVLVGYLIGRRRSRSQAGYRKL